MNSSDMKLSGTQVKLPAVCDLLRIAVLIAAFIATSSGCSLKVRVGHRPDVESLTESLVVGESSKSDVERAVGSPFGIGRAMLPFHESPRDMWSYYYEEGTLSDDRRIFVFIYFDADIYDGHLWFSSLPD